MGKELAFWKSLGLRLGKELVAGNITLSKRHVLVGWCTPLPMTFTHSKQRLRDN